MKTLIVVSEMSPPSGVSSHLSPERVSVHSSGEERSPVGEASLVKQPQLVAEPRRLPRRPQQRHTEVVVVPHLVRAPHEEEEGLAQCADHDGPGCAAAEGVRPAVDGLPVLVDQHVPQPDGAVPLLLHQADLVPVHSQEMLVHLVKGELLATLLPLSPPLTLHHHEPAGGLVLQPQLRPGLREESRAAPASEFAVRKSRTNL